MYSRRKHKSLQQSKQTSRCLGIFPAFMQCRSPLSESGAACVWRLFDPISGRQWSHTGMPSITLGNAQLSQLTLSSHVSLEASSRTGSTEYLTLKP